MKYPKLGTVALTALIGSAGTSLAQTTLSLDFASLPPPPGSQIPVSTIVFNGSQDSFSFQTTAPGGAQWAIGDETGSPSDSALGLAGAINPAPGNTVFSYGPNITTVGLLQMATVNTPGQLVIPDGVGGFLTGTVDFINVSTYGKVGGFLNADVEINLTDVLYNGKNPDLQFLDNNQPGTVDLSFQFAPGETLTGLSTGSGYSTTYSGSISVTAVPEPSGLLMSALGGLGALGFLSGRRKSSWS